MYQFSSKYLFFCSRPKLILTLLLLCVALVLSSYSNAQAFRKVVLKYRDAEDVKQVIEPLLPQGSAISVDNNSVLVRAPTGIINSVVKAIRSLDKPRKNLMVSVFRGKYPNKKGVITYTTDTHVNQLQRIATQEGQIVVLTERGLVKITVSEALYASNIDAPTTPMTLAAGSAVQLILEDDELVAAAEPSETGEGVEINSLLLGGSNLQQFGEVGRSQQSELVDVPAGLHLRVTLAGKNRSGQLQARVTASVVSKDTRSSSMPKDTSTSAIYLSSSVKTLTTFPLGEWTPISESNTLSHRPVLGANTKVYSTNTREDNQQSVWVRVEME
ncbi:MAG: hypothetical protein ACI8VC_002226 [Candidatus Endobugula sp.]|jgi:hypothetical protein